jgi:undecaprenyl pyrophosphate phosphatase UppP
MKFLFFTVLLTIVYSWEDIVASFKNLQSRLVKKADTLKNAANDDDHFVGTVLLIVWIPISMILFLASDDLLTVRLGWLIAQLLLISLFLRGVVIFKHRISRMDRYSGWERVGLALFSIAGLALPTYKLARYQGYYNERLVAKFASILCLPAIAGYLINKTYPNIPSLQTEVLPNINQLIIVMVGGLFTLFTIEFLEDYLRVHTFKLFSSIRIVIGLFLFAILINGII